MNRSPASAFPLPARGRWDGVGHVVLFNWPQYAAGSTASALAITAALLFPHPRWSSVAFWVAGVIAAYLLAASLVVSAWVYDLSPLYKFRWAPELAGPSPRRILNLHSGFDESSLALRAAFPDARLDVMDFYDPATMTEPSIARARRHQEATHPAELAAMTRGVSSGALPVEDGSIDAAFAILAAHEIRRPEGRRRFFDEITRGLRGGGRLVLVEHLRDVPNFLAFGPQFTHFYSRAAWLGLAREAGLELVAERRVTPFVGIFVFQKPALSTP